MDMLHSALEATKESGHLVSYGVYELQPLPGSVSVMTWSDCDGNCGACRVGQESQRLKQ